VTTQFHTAQGGTWKGGAEIEIEQAFLAVHQGRVKVPFAGSSQAEDLIT